MTHPVSGRHSLNLPEALTFLLFRRRGSSILSDEGPPMPGNRSQFGRRHAAPIPSKTG